MSEESGEVKIEEKLKIEKVWKKITGIAAVGVISLSLLVAGSSTALAAPRGEPIALPDAPIQSATQMLSSKATTSDDLKSLNESLGATDLPRSETSQGSKTTYTYTVPNGSKISLVKNVELNLSGTAGGRAAAVPAFRVAVENWSGYVYLNRTDQGALSAGGAAALSVAICASLAATGPAGWAGCAVVTGLLTTATVYIGSYGICSNEMRLTIWGGGGSAVQCV